MALEPHNLTTSKPETLSSCYRDLSSLGVPIIIGQIGTIVMSFADTLMIGHHSTLELAAASFVNNMFVLVIIMALGYSYSITPVVGSQYGINDYRGIGQTLKNGVVANLGISVVLIGAMTLLYLNIARLGLPSELIPLMRPYFLVQLVSLPFVCFANAFKQFFDGITDTQTSMWILLTGNVVNIVGNWMLIYGNLGMPELGLLGAGISTCFARLLVAVAFAVFFLRSSRCLCYRGAWLKGKIKFSELRKLNALGLPLSVQMGLETGAFSLSGILVGWIGTTALAAHQIMLTVSQLGFMVYYGFGAAVAIKVSMSKGRQAFDEARRYAHAGFHLALMVASAVSLPLFLFRNSLGLLFTDDAEVCGQVAVLLLPFVLYQIGDCLQCVYSNGLRGLTVVKPLVPVAFVAYFVISLPLGYLLGIKLGMGLEGVWLAFPAGLTTAGIAYLACFVCNVRGLSKKM